MGALNWYHSQKLQQYFSATKSRTQGEHAQSADLLGTFGTLPLARWLDTEALAHRRHNIKKQLRALMYWKPQSTENPELTSQQCQNMLTEQTAQDPWCGPTGNRGVLTHTSQPAPYNISGSLPSGFYTDCWTSFLGSCHWVLAPQKALDTLA